MRKAYLTVRSLLLWTISGIHFGVVCTLLDSAMGSAVMSTLDAKTGYSTVDLSVHLTRAISAKTGSIVAEGRVLHRGGRIVTAEGRLTDAVQTFHDRALNHYMNVAGIVHLIGDLASGDRQAFDLSALMRRCRTHEDRNTEARADNDGVVGGLMSGFEWRQFLDKKPIGVFASGGRGDRSDPDFALLAGGQRE